ncbi:MAG: hypothetical protein JSR86_20625 [Proteobacteria bacterium]|nr:hypothetical protein [Pseudomonadota bacterium]
MVSASPLVLRPVDPPRYARLEADAKGLGRYVIDVSLPVEAQTVAGAGLPVILAVDGNLTFEAVRDVVHGGLATAARSFPPCIVIGVGYPQTEGFAGFYARRTFDFHEPWDMQDVMGRRLGEIFAMFRDAEARPDLEMRTGGYDRFLGFLRDDLLPALAIRYPIDLSARHTLVGHSGGGRFALRVLFDPTSPFSRYVAISPGIGADEPGLVAAEAAFADGHTDLDADVFVCAGDEETGGAADFALCRFGSAVTWTAERFAARRWPSARLGWEIMNHEDHTSILPRAVAAGLRSVHRLRPGVHRAEVAEAAARLTAMASVSSR